MTTSQLPERPNLEQLKRLAKDLLHRARNADPASIARFRTLPGFASEMENHRLATRVALHDAQSVIAREHGCDSWKTLVEQIEEMTLAAAGALEALIEAATDGRTNRAERLLAARPGLARGSFEAALLLGDKGIALDFLRRQPERANSKSGPRNWEPLLYLCHAPFRSGDRGVASGRVAIARRLLELGADPNARYPWKHHGVQRPALWGAVCQTCSLELAEVLLIGGADANDGVTLALAASGGNLPALELLRGHGADVNGVWATDGTPCLFAILHWTKTEVGVRWLLENGASPNGIFGTEMETPVHVAARCSAPAIVKLLLDHGADPNVTRADGRTPYALAAIYGNLPVVQLLRCGEKEAQLSPPDAFVAACQRNDEAAARTLLDRNGQLISEVNQLHPDLLHRAAEGDEPAALRFLLNLGFEPNKTDAMGATPLHRAAHEGRVEATRLLLAARASTSACDNEFRAPPLVWAADGCRNDRGRASDFSAVAQLLIDAGSPVDWKSESEPADEIGEIIADWRASGRTSSATDASNL
ncbi:MAG TPA: ankyrin repeat domain-containing protein [Candidatus Didemnitutus sp.]|nr:ankyrin repeat domain-containing protein [Candidatus Didemnitutus sp.]